MRRKDGHGFNVGIGNLRYPSAQCSDGLRFDRNGHVIPLRPEGSAGPVGRRFNEPTRSVTSHMVNIRSVWPDRVGTYSLPQPTALTIIKAQIFCCGDECVADLLNRHQRSVAANLTGVKVLCLELRKSEIRS